MSPIKYTSRYVELAFDVDGVERKFSEGIYFANSPEEVDVLDRIPDAIREDNEEQPEETEKPAAKAPRKGAAKSSE